MSAQGSADPLADARGSRPASFERTRYRRWLPAIGQWLSRSGRQVDPVDVQFPWIGQRREPGTRVSGIGVQREPLTSSVGQGDCYA